MPRHNRSASAAPCLDDFEAYVREMGYEAPDVLILAAQRTAERDQALKGIQEVTANLRFAITKWAQAEALAASREQSNRELVAEISRLTCARDRGWEVVDCPK